MRDFQNQLAAIMPTALYGRVVRTDGLTVSVSGLPAPVGALVEVDRQVGNPLSGEVVGFRDALAVVSPHGGLTGIRHGNQVRVVRTSRTLRVGSGLQGRVVNAHGCTIDGRPTPFLDEQWSFDQQAPAAVQRPRIDRPLSTGIRAIDGLLTCGRGQRMGVFSGAGVGKSVTLGMIARHTSADVNVIALIGERGREVNHFIQDDLGQDALRRSVVVVATSDEPAILRVQAAKTATAIAEYFREQGRHVLLLMDSLTRFATAQREIGLAAGESPTTRGYPPSVFALLPRLVERAGATPQGSITAFYSVLVEGDDPNEPIADSVRGLLDGHTALSRALASQGHYPPIDVLGSISRLAKDITPDAQQRNAASLRRLMAAHQEHQDLIAIGAYRHGANPDVDVALALQDAIRQYLCQTVSEPSRVEEARTQLQALMEQAQAARNQLRSLEKSDQGADS